MFNIGQNFQSYITPIFIFFLFIYIALSIRTIFKAARDNKGNNKLAMIIIIRTAIFAFFMFAFFIAYGPNENLVNYSVESKYIKDLKAMESPQIEDSSNKDSTGYFDQVGNFQEEKEAADARNQLNN